MQAPKTVKTPDLSHVSAAISKISQNNHHLEALKILKASVAKIDPDIPGFSTIQKFVDGIERSVA